MNGELHYNFTALDNLMDHLWENKLIPGKHSSLPPQLATSVCSYCNIIKDFKRVLPTLLFIKNILFLLAFTSCPCKCKQCEKNTNRMINTKGFTLLSMAV